MMSQSPLLRWRILVCSGLLVFDSQQLSAGVLIDLGRYLVPTAVSTDGTSVVGLTNNFNQSPTGWFRWSQPHGAMVLPPPTYATGMQGPGPWINGDGTVLAWSTSPYYYYLWEWTPSGGLNDLGWPQEGSYEASLTAWGLSAEGSAIVGEAMFPQFSAADRTLWIRGFFWTRSGGFEPLKLLSSARAVSADGNIIVGPAFDRGLGVGLMNRTKGFRGLGLPAGVIETNYIYRAESYALVPSGETLYYGTASYGQTGRVSVFARWSASASAWERLDREPLPNFFQVTGTSSDGTLVVGTHRIGNEITDPSQGWIWRDGDGFQNIRAFLTDRRVNASGWQITSCSGISGDGRTLIGRGLVTESSGYNALHGWVAILDDTVSGPPFEATPARARPGIQLEVWTRAGLIYQLQRSRDGFTWYGVGDPFIGDGRTHRYYHLTDDPLGGHCRYVELP
ncbi:MAG: hypothetical protein JNK85_04900 [Verrucomicrobiales bacterium]|nr:hypothetical protein [Verrucomicrobiales bacterium]